VSDNPAEFARKLSVWQRQHGRHDLPWQGTHDPYRIWVSEIMLQQTQVGAVIGYFERFMDRFPDVRALALATEDEVLRLWSGLGYYARARNMHKAARMVVELHDGKFPQTANAIQTLPGIGRSTAAAIAAFAFGECGAILDGNVKRVLARYFGVEGFPGSKKVETELWELAASLLPEKGRASGIEAYTQGLMDLGATVCTRGKPACDKCPLENECVARTTDRVAELPAPRPRKPYPTREATWLVLRQSNEVLLERRPSPGIWGGLWAFPELGGKNAPSHCRSEFGCTLSNQQLLPTFSHGFTHFRLEISALLCTVVASEKRMESPGRMWIGVNEALRAAVPVPVRKVLNQLLA
jgi:A/G-specific adenine glycosylase